jgi:CheY-like chemotaxis protein
MNRWAKAALEASKSEATDKAHMLALLEIWRDQEDKNGLDDCHTNFNQLTELIVRLEESKDLRRFLAKTSCIYNLPYPFRTWGDWWDDVKGFLGIRDGYWVEVLCARFLLWWRRHEIAIEAHNPFRREFLRELAWEVRGTNIIARVDYAIEHIDQRMASPDNAVDLHHFVDLILAKYGFAKLPPIIPEPPRWPPHKWSVSLQRWEPVDPEHMERYTRFANIAIDGDDSSADDNPSIEQTQQAKEKPKEGFAKLAEQHRYFFGEPPSRPARASHEPNPWAGAVVSASKTLATNKLEMQVYLDTMKTQQKLYGYPMEDLEQLAKQLDQASDLQEFLKAIDQTSTEPEPRNHPTERRTILLVQGEDALRLLNARGLRSRGYGVIEASNGIEAMEALEAKDGAVDLVISDVATPGMEHGPTLVKAMRDRSPNLRFLLIGYAEDSFEKSLPENEFAFLRKPFTLGQLVPAVRKIVRPDGSQDRR